MALKQKDLFNNDIKQIKINRKACCLNCLGRLPNNHWSFCCSYCKQQFKLKHAT